jgi:DNA-binding transcriptional regulator YdaS (Cro superfamily)
MGYKNFAAMSGTNGLCAFVCTGTGICMGSLTEPPAADALRCAVNRAGSQSAFASQVGTSQQNVSNWLRGAKHLPGEYVLKAEAATGISRHDLRPDLYPRENPTAAAERTIGSSAPAVACDPSLVLQTGER